MKQKLPLTFILICACFFSFGQSTTISGRVIDDDTDEGLPFSNVFFKGTTTGVSTDIDGYYSITINERMGDSLSVLGIGYIDQAKYVSNEAAQTINFRMKSSAIAFNEVVVLAGENPANDIIRGIIKNKPRNNIANLDSYTCESYSKLELDLDNIDKLENRKILKQFDFVFENIDSTSDIKPFLPAFITETLADLYYVKGSPIKEMPKAIEVSGMQNQSMIDLLATFQEKFNIYDNWFDILGKQFVSPFSDAGLSYYEYYIQDTMMIDGFQSIKLKFKPKRKQENTFFGDFWVADSLFALQRVNMRMSKGVNINLVNRIIVYQEFQLHGDSIYLPAKEKGIIDFAAIKNAPGLIGRRTSTYRKYTLNPSIQEEYKDIDVQAYSIPALKKDKEFWAEGRHEKLTETEQQIYSLVDSIKNVPIFKTYSAIFYTLSSGWKTMGPLEIGRLYTLYSSNDVEGPRLRVDLGTSNDLSKRIRFGIYGAYGFKDKKFKYGSDFQWNIRKGIKRTILGGAYKNDVSYSNNSSEEIGDGSIFSSFYRRDAPEKLLAVEEGKLYFEHVWKKGWSNRVTFLHRRLDPFGFIYQKSDTTIQKGFNYSYIPDLQNPSQVDSVVTSTEFVINTRYALGERVLQGEFDQVSLGSKKPILTLQLTFGVPKLLNSQQGFQKVVLGIEHYFYLNPIGWTEYNFKVGKVFGTLPYLLLETHPGNETFFYSEDAFNSMNRFEFASDAFAMLHMQHHFDGFIFNRIPLVRKADLRLFASYKAVIGTLSDKNREANQLNFVDQARTRPITSPGPLPYMEAGVGIENILKIFRVAGVWRLTYLDNAEIQKFSVRVGIDFNF